MVRAYPRRLFNIQAVDGVSITLSFTLISVLYCNNRANGRPFNIRSMMNTGTAEIVFHSISSKSRAHSGPDTKSHFSSSLLKLKNPCRGAAKPSLCLIRRRARAISQRLRLPLFPTVSIMRATSEAETDEPSLPSHLCVILSLCNSLYCGLPHVSVSYFMISNLF